MRIGVIVVPAALLAFSIPTAADTGSLTAGSRGTATDEDRDSRVEVSGFLGVDYYGDEVGLGGSPAPEQRPQTAPTFGGRVTYIPLRIGSGIRFDLGVEAEASFTPSWTGYGFDGPRPSYFAPVIGYHGGLLFRLATGAFQPHLTAGGGGETVVSSSPYMTEDTDPVFQYGVGCSIAIGPKWLLRVDARQGLMEAMDGSTTFTYEAHMSIGARLGVRSAPAVKRVEVAQPDPGPPPPPRDTDGDGIVDPNDACPLRAENVNGVEDEDGCPETDRDGDGLVDVVDKCPDRAEDFDQFEDEDGCADDDNDGDGLPDLRDKCPLEPENMNGIEDDDGCRDEVPLEITMALAEARKVKFDRGRAPLPKRAQATLDKALRVALNNPRLPLTVTVHPETADPAATELANKRLNVVKFYMTNQGIAVGNLTALVGAPIATKTDPIVELTVTQQ